MVVTVVVELEEEGDRKNRDLEAEEEEPGERPRYEVAEVAEGAEMSVRVEARAETQARLEAVPKAPEELPVLPIFQLVKEEVVRVALDMGLGVEVEVVFME